MTISVEHRNGHSELPLDTSAWHRAESQAAYDFRSDYVTCPNLSMLQSIINTSLGDDVMMEDSTTNDFQAFMADLCGHEDALLAMSGTMANQVALRSALTCAPYAILADRRSHIITLEAGGPSTLSGALIVGVEPSNGHHLTIKDVQRHAQLRDDIYDCPTRVISLENTLNGTVMPLQDVQEISRWARSQDPPIFMYLDGARLWEAVAAGCGTLKEYAACFDSFSLCFTKGLGAPNGSMIIGSKTFIKRCRWWRKAVGGGIRAAGVVAAPARVAVEQVFLGGRLQATQMMAKRIAQRWESLGGTLEHPTETNMIWLDLDAAEIDKEVFADMAQQVGIRTIRREIVGHEGRLVMHYQISDDAVSRLFGLFTAVLGERKCSNGVEKLQ
ncbi:Aldolase [Lachnellula occidentalis]|uniref:Aldolase n=1 Tax=Lachnellula occidentalis TaxID=215460 RepID=A0A8H8UE56_9HELO|nr:Aldolase [Lachnellula occidentalis]